MSPSLLENASVDLKHDRRGLLTRRKLAKGSEFGLTLGPDPELDGSHEVFGRLLQVCDRTGEGCVFCSEFAPWNQV